jgi:hypothetical protein
MDTPVLSSALLLTSLSLIGLVFFIRASVKERTERFEIVIDSSLELILERLQEYFEGRAYQVIERDRHRLVFEGFVRPSLFLAIFLTMLAAIALFCLALVLSVLYPNLGNYSFFSILLSFLTTRFYWQKAGRLERVIAQASVSENSQGSSPQTLLKVTAHKDELNQLKQSLSFKIN